jgi:hypothetical protein
MKYYLARRDGGGWSLEEFQSLEEIRGVIKTGGTYGCEFKVLKEIDFEFTDSAAHGRKAEMKYLAELLEDSNVTICKLCKRLNPQHENCTGCSDLKTRNDALAKIKEAGE